MTNNFCNGRPPEICFLYLANECFAGAVIGKPLLGQLKGGWGDDIFHHGVDFIFFHGLDFVPSFIAGSTVVFYQEIKWTPRPETARPTADILTEQRNWTSPSAGLKHFGLKLSCLCVQTSRSGFRRPFGKLNKFKAVITFHDSEIL